MSTVNGVTVRGTSNKNKRGSSYDVRRRKRYLLDTYRADVDVVVLAQATEIAPAIMMLVPLGEGEKAARCYRCGTLLIFETLTTDRIVPGCKKTPKYPNGGTYVRENIRPCCMACNAETGGAMANGKEHQAAKRPRVSRTKGKVVISE